MFDKVNTYCITKQSYNIKSYKKMEEKTFMEIYRLEKSKPTPAQAFIKRMASLTKKSESTVRQWVLGCFDPDDLTKDVIAKELGIDSSVLFPQKVEHN